MPAMNSAKKMLNLKTTPRTWLILLFAFMIIFTPLYLMASRRSDQLKAQEDALLRQKQALSERVFSLKSDLEYVRSNAGIEQYARAEGMIMPGEIKYTTSSGAEN